MRDSYSSSAFQVRQPAVRCAIPARFSKGALRFAFLLNALLLLLAALSVPAAAATAPAIKVTVSPATATLKAGASLQLTATVTNSTNKAVTWAASAGTVSAGGLFVAPSPKTAGTVTITATTVATPKQKATASVQVQALAPLQVTTSSLPSGTVGKSFSATLGAAGGTPPYTWVLKAGQVLPGISLSGSSGVLAGAPNLAGGYKPSFTVTDAARNTVSVTLALTVAAPAPPSVTPSADMFGMHQLTRGITAPTVAYGYVRLWDSQTGWSQINTTQGVYDFTKFDLRLGDAKTKGAEVLYNLGRTPVWAQCGPTTASSCQSAPGDCSYTDSGEGQCYWPGDLNADGTGSNQHWKDWVTAVVSHALSLNAGQYAHVRMYEIWNEPNTKGNWRGTPAQLARLTQDAACIIKGTGTGCSQVGLDSSASIVGVPYVGGSTAIPSNATAYLYTAGASQYVDAIGFHGYSNEPEDLLGIVSSLRAVLSAQDQAKPMYDTEVSWGLHSTITDPDEHAGWVAKSVLMHWTAGVSRTWWYAWDGSGTMWSPSQVAGCTTPSNGGYLCTTADAYSQVQNWIFGATLSNACAANGTVWTCQIVRDGGYQGLIVWNTATRCSQGVCASSTFDVDPKYLHYRDLAGSSNSVVGVTVAIGYKPILLENR